MYRKSSSQSGIDVFADFPSFIGGSTIAIANVRPDVIGKAYGEIVVASSSGMRGLVRVYKVVLDTTKKTSSFAKAMQISDPNVGFNGGLQVTLADVNGDKYADIITGAGPSGKGLVQVFDGKTGAKLSSFRAFTDVSTMAPVRVVARDIDGDGKAEIFVAQGQDGRNQYQVKRFRALTGRLVDSIFATNVDFSGGGVFMG